jgi:hypothetical protein
VKRIEVNPADVRIVGSPTREPLSWLRRHRLRIAALLALAEAILWSFDVSKTSLLAVAAAAIAFHLFVTPRIPSYTVRQVSWTLAFAQALVAIGTVLLILVSTLVAVLVFGVLVAVVLAGVAALLGDRR